MKLIGSAGNEQYLVQAILRACEVLRSFRFEGEELRLRDLVTRTGLNKATLYRVIVSLERGGLMTRTADDRYRASIKPLRRTKFRLGYAGQGPTPFNHEVTESIRRVAKQERIDLIVLDNRFNAKVAVRNAEELVHAGVDLAIEYQSYEQVAPVISSKFLDANIPLIAIAFPHPGATYYGANNYQAGLMGGRALARWAKQHWRGKVDAVLILARRDMGSMLQARVMGIEMGIKEVLTDLKCPVTVLEGEGQFSQSRTAVRRRLRSHRAENSLVGAINDASALGALRAFEETGRAENCAVLGQGASGDARSELRRPGTRLVGSVAYFTEHYGEDLISLALKILNRKPVPPAVFVKHRLLTPENVNQYYPDEVR